MNFCVELLNLSGRLAEKYESFCLPLKTKYRINQTKLDIIMFVANNPGLNTARDICEVRGMKSGIVSVAVDSLAASGYMERECDAADKRLQRLRLTFGGLMIAEEGKKIQRVFSEALYRGVGHEELARFSHVFETLSLNLSNMNINEETP